MRKIIFTRPDGGVSIVHPLISVDDPEGFTEDQAIERALLTIPQGALNVTVVDESVIPSDRSNRRAWKQIGASITVDPVRVAQIFDEDAVKAIDGMDRLQFEHLFDLENRTRVLEAKAPITRAQYRDALITRWKQIHSS
jgi:hypothetical protein